MTRSTWRLPFRGGSASSIRSVNMTRPTLSLLVIAEKARRAPSSAARACLVWRRLPKMVDALASTTSMTVSSRSSAKRFTCGVPERAVTFQSIVRTSSPGW